MKRLSIVPVVLVSLALSHAALAADKKAEKNFKTKCSSCHGKDGKGQTEKGQKMGVRDMASAEFQKGTDAEWKKAILEGFKRERDGKKQEMEAFAEELEPGDVDALLKLVREFKK